MIRRPRRCFGLRTQQGAALLVSILLFALIGVSVVLTLVHGRSAEADRDQRTGDALAQAKTALLGYAAAVPLTGPERLGDLPCPDHDNDGNADPPCSGAGSRIGRLPWRTLGLPDLRDGDGERLWYAVSVGFRNNPRTPCTTPQDPGCLNSDSTGSITVRNSANVIVHDGAARIIGTATEFNYSGAIAVVIAPGTTLTRVGGYAQLRGDAAAINDPVNYLDLAFGEDNANFADNDGNNGFIGGPIRSGTGELLVNDRIAVVAHSDLIPLLEKRVVREVSVCLDQYGAANGGRYPWASDTVDNWTGRYADASGRRAGRIPDGTIVPLAPASPPPPFPVEDQVFTNTQADSGGTMTAAWTGAPCNLGLGLDWWMHWKLYVFYSVAETYQPADITTAPPPSCGTCLTVATSMGNVAGVRYFVAAAGRRMPSVSLGQPRAAPGDLANPANFLEGENVFGASTPDRFEEHAAAAAFNDTATHR